MPTRILIASDAWAPQINGVVRTLEATIGELCRKGFRVDVIHPGDFTTIPAPFYPEIRLAWVGRRAIQGRIDSFQPRHIHIATEGPIGLAVRRFCIEHDLAFTTSFHTHFPKYLKLLCRLPEWSSWRYLEWFHRRSSRVLAATTSIRAELAARRIYHTAPWSRGVDTELFFPRSSIARPKDQLVLLYVGRVSIEKNIEAFLRCRIPGRKYVVGDGPARVALMRRYPDVQFLGYRQGNQLGELYASADVVVFPSFTDTFGNVVLEALASGVPVAAHRASGPSDLIIEPALGCCHDDLSIAIEGALLHGRGERCVEYARTFSWRHATDQFIRALVPIAAWAPRGDENYSNTDDFLSVIEGSGYRFSSAERDGSRTAEGRLIHEANGDTTSTDKLDTSGVIARGFE